MASGGAEVSDLAAEAPLLVAKPGEPPRRNTFAFICATLASMTTILMGYNLALMSGAELFIREDLGLADEQVEVLSGSMNVFMLVMTFISVAGGITMAGCFFLYAGAMVAAWVFVYVRLPETRGRSLEDMDVLFAK
uniref:Major facilitator superfamily (MFS) profile domain-containing protein n=1 Tax=Oryza brachyantha TaxID=4533 RepID=J3N9S0_ORYBR